MLMNLCLLKIVDRFCTDSRINRDRSLISAGAISFPDGYAHDEHALNCICSRWNRSLIAGESEFFASWPQVLPGDRRRFQDRVDLDTGWTSH